MNLNEAREVCKEIGPAISTLLAAAAGIKESDFDALQARKSSLEAAIADLRKKVIAESNAADLEIANAQAAAKEKKAEIAAEMAKAEANLAEVQRKATAARDALQAELREHKAAEITAKTTQLRSLNMEIEAKQSILDKIREQIEEGRRRFA